MTTKPLRGIHVFWMVFAFFAIVAAVDVLFIVRAVGSFPGEDAPNSYLVGLDYNSTLARRSEQEKLGWRADAGVDNGSTLIVRMRTRVGEPLRGLDVSVVVHRIGRSEEGATVRLAERRPGEYAAAFDSTDGGRFMCSIKARRQGEAEIAFEASKTLVMR